MTIRHRLLVFLITPVVISACSSVDQASPAVQQTAVSRAVGGIIVKPRNPVVDEATLMKMVDARLTSSGQVRFSRAMSGGAYVLSVFPPATPADIPSIVAQLSASGLFEYVEVDQAISALH